MSNSLKSTKSISYSALRRAKTGGFVIGYVLVGLALLASVIAALTSGNKVAANRNTDSPEAVRIQANQVIRAASETRDAMLRFVTNGLGGTYNTSTGVRNMTPFFAASPMGCHTKWNNLPENATATEKFGGTNTTYCTASSGWEQTLTDAGLGYYSYRGDLKNIERQDPATPVRFATAADLTQPAGAQDGNILQVVGMSNRVCDLITDLANLPGGAGGNCAKGTPNIYSAPTMAGM